jgi:Histidine kinase
MPAAAVQFVLTRNGNATMADSPTAEPAPAGSTPNAARRERTEKVLAALSRGGLAGAGAVGRAAAGVGNWVASIGWGKFILLSFVLLAFMAMLDSVFEPSREQRRQWARHHVPVEVKISVDSQGLHVTGPPRTPTTPPPPGTPAPRVRIDEKGVRIQSEHNGSRESVVIDRNGVRIERAAPETPALPKSPDIGGKAAEESGSAVVTVPPDMLSDPDKVAEAVDAARDQIEEILKEQVNRKVAALPKAGTDEASTTDLADWALMLVFVLLITKLALGSKRRAESRAQAASAVAAEEGLKRQLAEAQLKTMQAQVEPHFLFNTLASVDYLIETDPARASRMQKNLIQFLRAALPQMRQASSTLAQEMALCRSYLEILKVRMDDRLQFAIVMPAGLSSAAFPPMMLQTLVENSIKHGLEPKPEGGALTLTADVVNGNLRVAVSDTGLGFGAGGSPGGGVGLNNVRERLQALFGGRARLTIEPNSPNGTIATIEVPYTVATSGATPQPSPQPA